MICRCYIIEVEKNKWLIALSECIEAHGSFGPFSSFWEVDSYYREYLSKYSLKPLRIDFEHPERADILRSIKGPPFKLKYLCTEFGLTMRTLCLNLVNKRS
jgi:hypothetical protein